MKSWLMMLPLLCMGSMAMAQGDAGAGAAMGEAVAAQEQTQVQTQTQTQSKAAKSRPRQGGDIRYCLDRKTNQAIHRCAASKRGK